MYLARMDSLRNAGFISTRFQGTDGVSLETEKWVEVFSRMNIECFFYAGLSDWDPLRTMVVPEAFFDHPHIRQIQNQCYGVSVRTDALSAEIHSTRNMIKKTIYEFVKKFSIDLLVVENALAIPMNIPLGLAITEFLNETGMPAIGHHHDFSWERQRFSVNCVSDFLSMAFPPKVHSMSHVTINTEARTNLGYRHGLSSFVVPNVFDYLAPVPEIDDFNRDLRQSLGITEDDLFILQPTRIVARKGIEHALELARRLEMKNIKLVISHQARDEGKDYYERVMSYANLMGVDLIVRPDLFGAERSVAPDGTKTYSLWDAYPHADFVTYPSSYEGFGNAFLEAVYFRKPIMVNRYSIYQQDIEPLGFEVALMDTYVTDDVVRQVKRFLRDPEYCKAAVDKNFELAKQWFSYEILEEKIRLILLNFGVKI